MLAPFKRIANCGDERPIKFLGGAKNNLSFFEGNLKCYASDSIERNLKKNGIVNFFRQFFSSANWQASLEV